MPAAAEFCGDLRNIHRTVGAQADMVAVHIAEFAASVFYFMDERRHFDVLNACLLYTSDAADE